MKRLLVVGDYSQLEPRLMAHFSEDPRLRGVYLPGGSGDVYLDMASGVFSVERDEVTKEQRDICKTLVLAMGYGAHETKVGAILTTNGYPTSVSTGRQYVIKLHQTYPVFFQWRDDMIGMAHDIGFVTTIGGRRRRIGEKFIDSRNFRNVAYGERQAVNAIVQGSAADIVRRVMVRSQPLFPELELLAQVHDELVWECDAPGPSPARIDALADFGARGHGYDLRVPLVFEPHVGDSWYSGKEGSFEPEFEELLLAA